MSLIPPSVTKLPVDTANDKYSERYWNYEFDTSSASVTKLPVDTVYDKYLEHY